MVRWAAGEGVYKRLLTAGGLGERGVTANGRGGETGTAMWSCIMVRTSLGSSFCFSDGYRVVELTDERELVPTGLAVLKL